MLTVGRSVRDRAAARPDETALVFLADGERESGRLTHSELDHAACAVASRLTSNGAAGAPVLIAARSALQFAVAVCGCFYAGAIAVPVPYQRRGRAALRLRTIVADARPSAVLTDAPVAVGEEPSLAGVPILAIDEPAESVACANTARGDAPAVIQYTSGSTSAPKGVVITHDNLVANIEMMRAAMNVHAGSRYVSWLPLHHDMGLVAHLLTALYCGAPAVLMPPIAFIQKPMRWLTAISRHRATISGAPNFAYELARRHAAQMTVDDLDLSCWETAFCGAEPVRARTMDGFADAYASVGFRASALFPCYGLAEATVFVGGGRIDGRAKTLQLAPATNVVSCGPKARGSCVVVVDPETRQPVPDGHLGELWVSGPHVANGYWQHPSDSARAFGVRLEGFESPFLRTGDLGAIADGDIYIAGRLDDVMLIQGSKVHPEDLEHTAGACHSVQGAASAVFSVIVEQDEQIVLVQELPRRRDRPTDAAAVSREIAMAIADVHGLTVFDIALVASGSLPRTTSGKLQRRQCRTLYLEGALASASGRPARREPRAAPNQRPA